MIIRYIHILEMAVKMMDPIDEDIAYLVDAGALVPHGMDGDEPTYRFVPEILKIVSPELYEIYIDELDQTLMALYEDGIVDVEYDENLNAGFRLTDKGQDYIKENGGLIL